MSRRRSEKTDQEWGPFHAELAIYTGHRSHEQRQHHRHQHPSAPLVDRHQFWLRCCSLSRSSSLLCCLPLLAYACEGRNAADLPREKHICRRSSTNPGRQKILTFCSAAPGRRTSAATVAPPSALPELLSSLIVDLRARPPSSS
jgi:hypothetical protein